MTKQLWTVVVFAIAAGGVRAEEKPAFKNDNEKFSYAQGMEFGVWLNRQEMGADFDALLRGLKDTVSSNQTLLSEQEMREALRDGRTKLQTKREEKRKQQAEENKKKAEAFLAENKAKPGIITTESGLQYKILTESTGPAAGSNAMVTVNFRGILLDGTEFDSTAKRGQPMTTPVGRGIWGAKGCAEALQQMKQGAKWQLFVSPDLGLGDRSSGPVPPGSLLIVEVEMLTNAPPPPPPAAAAPAAPLTSDIIKVPSLEEMKKGAKIETIKAEDVEKLIKQEQQQEKEKK